jgi:hypothetical protein
VFILEKQYLMVSPWIPIINQCPKIGQGDFIGVNVRRLINRTDDCSRLFIFNKNVMLMVMQLSSVSGQLTSALWWKIVNLSAVFKTLLRNTDLSQGMNII